MEGRTHALVLASATILALPLAPFVLSTLGNEAYAQTRNAKGAPKKPAPPKADADAAALDASPAGLPDAAASPAEVVPPRAADLAGASGLTPLADEMPSASTRDGGALRAADVDRLLGDLVALRMKAAVVGDATYASKIRISVEDDAGKVRAGRVVVLLDDGVVYDAKKPRFEDLTVVYAHAIAPGRHTVGVVVERDAGGGDESFKSSASSRFVVVVPDKRELTFDVTLDAKATMGADFPTDREGAYFLSIRAKSKAR